MIGTALSLLAAGLSEPTWSAELYSLPGENGLELFLLDNHLQTPALKLRPDVQSRLMVAEDGSLTFTPQDSLAKYFDLNETAKTDGAKVEYRGFLTSPLGRVLSVAGEFKPNLGSASMETANSQQPEERKFDLGSPQSGRNGWDQDLGLKVLSF